MKTINLKAAILILLIIPAFLIVPAVGSAAAKPRPVKGLMEMFDTFNGLEEEFREENWEEAEEIATKIESDYKTLVNDLKGTVDGKLVHKFGFLIGSFKKQLEKKDAELLEKPYMNLQELFVDIMSYFDYPHPPVFVIINLYLNEAEEYLEKGMFKHVAEEMEEIHHFKDRAVADAKSYGKDSAKLEELFGLAEKVEDMSAKGDKEGLEKTLGNACDIMKELM
jgi:hypothetical protein